MNYLAKWNSTNWSALPSTVNGTVYALTFDNLNNLYVGGNFTTANSTTVNRIAKYSTANVWSALGTGVNAIVAGLHWNGGKLYVNGMFSTASLRHGKVQAGQHILQHQMVERTRQQ
jgi:hypothetical protein